MKCPKCEMDMGDYDSHPLNGDGPFPFTNKHRCQQMPNLCNENREKAIRILKRYFGVLFDRSGIMAPTTVDIEELVDALMAR